MQSCAVKFIMTCLHHHDLSTHKHFDLLDKYLRYLEVNRIEFNKPLSQD